MPDPEELLGSLRFGGAMPPNFRDIRRQARRRRIRHLAMAAVPLSVIAALAIVPRLADDGPPAAVVAFAPNGEGLGPAVPSGPVAPAPAPPATTTATSNPPTISTLVSDDAAERGEVSDVPLSVGEEAPAGDDGAGEPPPTTAVPVTQSDPDDTTTVGTAAVDPPPPTTQAVLAVDPAPPLEPGPLLDDLATLPPMGFAVVQDGVAVLADPNGAVIGHLPTDLAEVTFGRPTPVLAADATTGCQVAEARRTLRVEICPRRVREHGATYDSREVRVARIDAPSIVISTPLGRDWYDDPSRPVLGHWRSAAVSPEARWMALEWGDQCGGTEAFVVDLATDDLASATGSDWPAAPDSAVLGWIDDDSLLLHLPDGPCGTVSAPPGVYRFSPGDGSLVQLATTDAGATAQLWSLAPVDQ